MQRELLRRIDTWRAPGQTQRDVARELGLDESYWSRIRHGRTALSIDVLRRIRRAAIARDDLVARGLAEGLHFGEGEDMTGGEG